MERNRATKRKFSSFGYFEALEYTNTKTLIRWDIDARPVALTPFFKERLRRLENFGIAVSEQSRRLLIDAICEESLERHPSLRMWVAIPLEGDDLTGVVDYLVSPRIAFPTHPLLCVVEAKKDDFEQGAAQCLVELKACQETNRRHDISIDVFGIVTNGEGWQFYKMTTDGRVFQSPLFATGDLESVLGALDAIFAECEANLKLTETQPQ